VGEENESRKWPASQDEDGGLCPRGSPTRTSARPRAASREDGAAAAGLAATIQLSVLFRSRLTPASSALRGTMALINRRLPS